VNGDASGGAEEMVEVLDGAGRVLALLPAREAHRQSLPHKAVLVLFFDRRHRLLLKKRPPDCASYPDRWDLPGRGHVQPGEAATDAAKRLAAQEYPDQGLAPVAQGVLSPTPGTGFETLHLFRCPAPAQEPLGERWERLPVGQEELAALAHDFRELLTPDVVHALEQKILFPGE